MGTVECAKALPYSLPVPMHCEAFRGWHLYCYIPRLLLNYHFGGGLGMSSLKLDGLSLTYVARAISTNN